MTALVEEQEHVPYKDSKLTMLLADALGGGAKTVLLVTASPADLDETFFIFDLAGRMSKIKVSARVAAAQEGGLLVTATPAGFGAPCPWRNGPALAHWLNGVQQTQRLGEL